VPHDGGCRIDYQYDIHLSGRVAMIGGRMLDGAARVLIGEFFRRFAMSLGGGAQELPQLAWYRRIAQLFGAGR
jgi:2-furoyl-CoA dehydrogenase large subunit